MKKCHWKVKNTLDKLYCKSQLFKYESGIKGTWNIIKDVIGKKKIRSFFPSKITVDIEIKDSLLIAENSFFNNFFADIDPKFASEILQLNN